MQRGFTLIELLIVIAIIGILTALGTPLYVNWRANTAVDEAARAVEVAVAAARSQAKSTGSTVSLTFVNGSSTYSLDGEDTTLPRGGELAVGTSPMTLTFAPPFGQQGTTSVTSVDVTTGSGRFERTATVSVIPPLGTTAVAR